MLNAIDLFSGSGGFSLGVGRAGFNIISAYDHNKNACDTYKKNNAETNVYCVDLSEVEFSYFDKYRSIDLVFGGPPCQPFSCANNQTPLNDKRNLILRFLKIVFRIKPSVFILENVPNILKKDSGIHIKYIEDAINMSEYSYKIIKLKAENYKVSQRRERVFIVGCINGDISVPEKVTRGRSYKAKSDEDRLPLVQDAYSAIANKVCNEITGTRIIYSKRLTSNLYLNGRGRPIRVGGVSNTITGKISNAFPIYDTEGYLLDYYRSIKNGAPLRVGAVNIEGVRRLSVRECQILQGYPDDYTFCGKITSKYLQIGNSVPPNLAYYLIKANLHLFNFF